jgi:hypothetical protein
MMKQLSALAIPLALLVALASSPQQARAQCACGGYGLRGTYTGRELIEVYFPTANLYPDGGWTLYPGEAGSGVPTCSNYAPVNGLIPPAATAQVVLQKLQFLGIPIVAPETQFLNKNPRIAEKLQLPIPKTWIKPKEEEKEKKIE